MLGFRIERSVPRVEQVWVDRFASLPVANVSDAMSRMFAGGASLRPMHAGGSLAGPALTVRTSPGDNLMIQKAIDIAGSGDVIVVDGGGEVTNALVGELMIAHARNRGIAGFVINGAIRDHKMISAGNFPVFAVGVTHRGPHKNGPGEINVSVSLDGMVVSPGDLVLGDADGVVAVPQSHLAEVFEIAEEKYRMEAAQLVAITERRNSRDWINDALRRLGVL
ncbi:RraA family protein [Devosia sp. A449]